MTADEKLVLLKMDLQQITCSNDAFLRHLLNFADAMMKKEGATDDGSIAYEGIQIEYAAYLFRKRAANTAGGKDSATAMPRFLRWQLNNLIFHQHQEDA